MFEQLPPHDVQAEESVLAALMVDDNVAAKVAPIVTAQDFFREQNAWTFAACIALWERGESINEVTVAHELDRAGRLDDAGGLSFISDLVLNLPTAVGAENFAAIVKRDATYRRMISAAMKVAQLGYEAGPDLEGALAKAEAAIYGLRSDIAAAGGFVLLRDLLGSFMEHREAEETPRALQSVRTGLRDLDAILGGLKPGALVIIAAATSQGKSALMCNVARNAAVTQNARVAFFTLEMPADQLAARILAADSRVDTVTIDRRQYSDQQLQRVMQALGVLDAAELYLDYCPGITFADLRTKCLKLIKEKGLDLIVVDYLQKMGVGRSYGTRNDVIGELTTSFAVLAGELDVPVIIGSQLSRKHEERESHAPILSDLRDSGNIEQDATVVVFIHREERFVSREAWEKVHPDIMAEPYPAGLAKLLVAKNRNGPVGIAEVRYRAKYTKFEDIDLPAASPVQGKAF